MAPSRVELFLLVWDVFWEGGNVSGFSLLLGVVLLAGFE